MNFKKLINEYGMGLAIILIAFAFFAFSIAWAGGSHGVTVVNKYSTTEVIENTINTESSGAVLGFAAAQCDISQSHYKMQWCIGGANYKSDSGIVFGIGQKFANTTIKATIGVREGEIDFNNAAIGFGASGSF